MAVKKYRLLRDAETSAVAKAGCTVYDIMKYDYGVAKDDTRFTGVHHVSVTLDPTGDYPFFTVPFCDLEEIRG